MDEPITLRQWTDIVRRARLGRTVKLVALTVATYADSDGTRVFPGTARLAVDCELTYNVVQNAMATLRRAGLIELVKRAGRRGTANEYRLTLDVDLLDRVQVLSPTGVVAQAAAVREARRVLEARPRSTTHGAGGQRGQDNPPAGLSTTSTTTHAPGGDPGTTTHGAGGPQPTPCVPTVQDHVTTTTDHSDSAVRTAAATPRTRPHQDPEPLWTESLAAAATATTPTAPNPPATPPDAPPAAPSPSDAPTPNPTRNTRQRPAQTARPARQTKPRSPRAPAATPPPPTASPTPAAPGDTPRIVWITQDHGPPIAAELVDQHPNRPHIVKIIYCHSRTAAWITRTRITTQEAAA